MTTREVAAAVGCSVTMVQQCARDGFVSCTIVSRPTGGRLAVWPTNAPEIVRGYLSRPVYVRVKSARFRNLREMCSRHGVPCVLHDLGANCDACPRDHRHESVAYAGIGSAIEGNEDEGRQRWNGGMVR